MRNFARLFTILCLLSGLIFTLTGCSSTQKISLLIHDNFDRSGLDVSQWKVTHAGDFAEMTANVIDVDPGEYVDNRLRLSANTIGTSDETVKFLGVRNMQIIDFTEAKAISFDLDWNNQANGCYLSAGIFLCPVSTDVNPATESDWIAFEYVGVPPGENARFQIAKMNNGNLQFLYTEGWPDQQRIGRKISNEHVEIIIGSNNLSVGENSKEIFSSKQFELNFSQAYLYLQMSSHSNYPTREVYFDNISVQSSSLLTQVP